MSYVGDISRLAYRVSAIAQILGITAFPCEMFPFELRGNLRCVACGCVPVEAMCSTVCGHRYCGQCVRHHFMKNEILLSAIVSLFLWSFGGMMAAFTSVAIFWFLRLGLWPLDVPCLALDCKKLLSRENVYVDTAFVKQLSRLLFKCTNEKCTFVSSLNGFHDHLEVCEYAKLHCECCGKQWTRRERELHMGECDEAAYACNHCGLKQVDRLLATPRGKCRFAKGPCTRGTFASQCNWPNEAIPNGNPEGNTTDVLRIYWSDFDKLLSSFCLQIQGLRPPVVA